MATCRKCVRFDQCADEQGDTPFYISSSAAANNVEDLCFAYENVEPQEKAKRTFRKKLTVKENAQIVIMVTAMQFGFSAMYRYLWLMLGQGCPVWVHMICVLLGGATNYIFVRWCGGMNDEKGNGK